MTRFVRSNKAHRESIIHACAEVGILEYFLLVPPQITLCQGRRNLHQVVTQRVLKPFLGLRPLCVCGIALHFQLVLENGCERRPCLFKQVSIEAETTVEINLELILDCVFPQRSEFQLQPRTEKGSQESRRHIQKCRFIWHSIFPVPRCCPGTSSRVEKERAEDHAHLLSESFPVGLVPPLRCISKQVAHIPTIEQQAVADIRRID
mmetsp:Transcript_46116/g.109607  ORF Transcript_46116/g.109607 Transcript_46116/m.109607 type:complete len:206 (+) Transcript_46116:354-971(+)